MLNAGSGPRSHRKINRVFDAACWREVRMDIDPAVAPDVVGSMTTMRTHFKPNSFDAIWSSHSLEHLYNHDIPVALDGFHHILKPDGFALITCPDLEIAMSLFLHHGPDHEVYRSEAGPITPLDMIFGHSASIERGAVYMAHRSGLTVDRLGRLLLTAGFDEVITRCHGFDLWALALMQHADRDAILRQLGQAGLDMSGDPA